MDEGRRKYQLEAWNEIDNEICKLKTNSNCHRKLPIIIFAIQTVSFPLFFPFSTIPRATIWIFFLRTSFRSDPSPNRTTNSTPPRTHLTSLLLKKKQRKNHMSWFNFLYRKLIFSRYRIPHGGRQLVDWVNRWISKWFVSALVETQLSWVISTNQLKWKGDSFSLPACLPNAWTRYNQINDNNIDIKWKMHWKFMKRIE